MQFGQIRLAALLLLAVPCLAQQTAKTYRVPFHSAANGVILLEAQVNGKPAVLLLDTGANLTIISQQAAGLPDVKLHALAPNRTTGSNGDYVRSHVDLGLGERHFMDHPIIVMDMSDASKRLWTRIDGLLGQDVLRQFSAVRIDYQHGVLELEAK